MNETRLMTLVPGTRLKQKETPSKGEHGIHINIFAYSTLCPTLNTLTSNNEKWIFSRESSMKRYTLRYTSIHSTRGEYKSARPPGRPAFLAFLHQQTKRERPLRKRMRSSANLSLSHCPITAACCQLMNTRSTWEKQQVASPGRRRTRESRIVFEHLRF